MDKLTAVCMRLVALCALSALLEPAAQGSPTWSGLKLVAGLLISASVLEFFLSLVGIAQG